MRKYILIGILICLAVAGYAYATVFVQTVASGGSYENFYSDYTLVDGAATGWVSIVSGSPYKITVSTFENDETIYVYKDHGVGHFSGDFTHQFETELTDITVDPLFVVWQVTNTLDEYLSMGGNPSIAVYWQVASGQPSIRVYDMTGSSGDSWTAAAEDTKYYITVIRDDDEGGNGAIDVEIRTGSHAGALQDTLEISLSAQEDFRYLYGLSSYDAGDSGDIAGAYSENYDLNE